MISRKQIFIHLAIAVMLGMIFNAQHAFAYEYTVSEPLPGMTTDTVTSADEYLGYLFDFLLGAAAVLAVVKIVMAGLKYIYAAGDSGKITEAKDDIYWAILGLILALSSVLILQTIGGQSLTTLDLSVKQITTGNAVTTGGATTGDAVTTGAATTGDTAPAVNPDDFTR